MNATPPKKDVSRRSTLKVLLRPLPRLLFLWIIIGLIIFLGVRLGVNEKIIGVSVAIFGFFTNAFSGLLALIALVPVAGPLVIKVISLPLFWLINGLGYILSAFAVKRGYAKEIINYRVLTVIFLSGLVVGFIIGSLF